MLDKDINEKLLTSINEVFADIFNNFCFDGKKVIEEKDLSDAQTINAYMIDEKIHHLDSDVSKYYKNTNLIIAMLNIENQSTIDKDMPFRIIGYEGAKYNHQLISGNNRYPVVTIVLNFDNKRWNKPLRLKECLKDVDANLDKFINDYHINVIDIAFLSKEEINRFTSDFKVIVDYFYQMKNEGDYIYRNKDVLKYPAQTMNTLSSITGDNKFKTAYNEYIEENKGGPMSMESALDKLELRAISKGRIEGKEEGVLLSLSKSIKALISKNYTFEQSCDLLDVDETTKEKLLNTGEFK